MGGQNEHGRLRSDQRDSAPDWLLDGEREARGRMNQDLCGGYLRLDGGEITMFAFGITEVELLMKY